MVAMTSTNQRDFGLEIDEIDSTQVSNLLICEIRRIRQLKFPRSVGTETLVCERKDVEEAGLEQGKLVWVYR